MKMPDTKPPVSAASLPDTNCYRIGLVGSRASGKTCLLAALNMQMTVNPLGYHAVMLALGENEEESHRNGYEWIEAACNALRNGEWPAPNYNNHEAGRLSVRFQFSDGGTREKMVELFDYSGELLAPKASQSELAMKLRGLLREMDAVIVLAEVPMPGQESTELNETLNGLLSVFSLLENERKISTLDTASRKPIALIVSKWDRSGHLNGDSDPENQARFLEQFLDSNPVPFHQNMINALRPHAADGRLKAFPVSACTPISADSGELPPKAGQLRYFGVQDPFIWLIQQRDELILTDAAERMKRLSGKWLAPCWTPLRELWELRLEQGRLKETTLEGKRLALLMRQARWLICRQIVIYVFLLLLAEAGADFHQHRKALSSINLPTESGGWKKGTDWLRGYGESSQFLHSFYSLIALKKQAALEQAYSIQQKKDDELLADCLKDLKDVNMEEAKRLAEEHKKQFPNSTNQAARERVLAEINQRERDLAFERLISIWRKKSEALQAAPDDAGRNLHEKLEILATLEQEVVNSTVPLEGQLRIEWKTLLSTLTTIRHKLERGKIDVDLSQKIQHALDADNYSEAADLLTGDDFPSRQNLIKSFQLGFPKHLQEKCAKLSLQGENWKEAVIYAEQFFEPKYRSILTSDVKTSVDSTILSIKMRGDQYLYKLALENEDNKSMDLYLNNAPLKSMGNETAHFNKWLQDREIPKTLVFRVTKIRWDNSMKKGWGSTEISLVVNHIADSRNSEHYDNTDRTGELTDQNGVRVVSIDNIRQTADVKLDFNFRNIPLIWGAWESLGSKSVQIIPEFLAAQGGFTDDRGNRMDIVIDGVMPKPPLPPWHSPQ